ncbi:MAG: hypothetical protein ACTSR5_00070 [Promethearchaeota archaeon]
MSDKYTYQTDIATQVNKYYQDSLKIADPNSARKEFIAKVKGYRSGLIPNIDQELVPWANRNFAFYSMSANNKIQARINESARAEQLSLLNNNVSSNTNLMEQELLQNNQGVAVTHRLATERMISDANDKGIISPTAYVNLQNNLKDSWNKSSVLGEYQLSLNQGLKQSAKFKEQFLKTPNAKFSEDDKLKMMRLFGAYDQQKAQAAGYTKQNYDNVSNRLVYNTTYGIDDSKENQAVEYLKLLNPSKFQAKVAPRLDEASKVNSILTQYKYSSPSRMKSAISELKITAPSFEDSKINQKASSILEADVQNMESDPVRYFASSPTLKSEIVHARTTGISTVPNVIVNYQKAIGIKEKDIKAVPNLVASNVVNAIKQYPMVPNPEQPNVPTQSQALARVVTGFHGQSRYYFLRQLQQSGLPSASQYLLRISNSDDNQVKALQTDAAVAFSRNIDDYKNILDAHSTNVSGLSKTIYGNSMFQNYLESMQGFKGDISKPVNNLVKHAQLLSAQLMSQGESKDDAVNNSMKALTSGIAYGSYHGYSFQYPKEFSGIGGNILTNIGGPTNSGMINRAVDYLHSTALNSDLFVPLHIGNALPKDARKEVVNSYVLSTSYIKQTPDGLGLELANQDGVPLKTTDGKKFEVLFKDLRNPSSEINEKLSNFEAVLKKDRTDQLQGALSKTNVKLMSGMSLVDIAKRLSGIEGR